MGRLLTCFILWARRRAPHRLRVVTFDDKFSFSRFEFLWGDEIHDASWDRHKVWVLKNLPAGWRDSSFWTGIEGTKKFNRPPFWRPFNAFLHCWRPEHDGEEFHDHPRWSITICLRGRLIERTPWATRILTPGSVVIRSRKAIHAFQCPKEHHGKTWTIFIVGRRNHRQNRYSIEAK